MSDVAVTGEGGGAAVGAALIGAAGGVLQSGGGIINGILQRKWAERMTNEQWKRDDTAVQRRAADMAAAGFNPVLATGAAAQSSAPVRAEFPDPNLGAPLEGALQGMQMAKDFAVKDRSLQVMQAQQKEIEARTAGIDLDNRLKEGVLQPNIDKATATAAYEMSTLDARIAREISNTNQQFADTLTSQWEEKIKKNEAVYSNWLQVKKTLEESVMRKTISKIEADTALAVAAGRLSGQKAEDFAKLGLSPEATDKIMKVVEFIVKLFAR